MKTPLHNLEKMLTLCGDFNLSKKRQECINFVDEFIILVRSEALTKKNIYDILLQIPTQGFHILGDKKLSLGTFLFQQSKNFGFPNQQNFKILLKLDLNAQYEFDGGLNSNKKTLSMTLASLNQFQKINLNPEQLCELFSKCDLSLQNPDGVSVSEIISYNNSNELKMSLEQFMSILKDQKISQEQMEQCSGLFYLHNIQYSNLSMLEVDEKINLVKHQEYLKSRLIALDIMSFEEKQSINKMFEKLEARVERKEIMKEIKPVVAIKKHKML